MNNRQYIRHGINRAVAVVCCACVLYLDPGLGATIPTTYPANSATGHTNSTHGSNPANTSSTASVTSPAQIYGSASIARSAPITEDGWNGPCGVLMEEGPLTSVSLQATIPDLIARTETITILIEQSLNYLCVTIIKNPLLVSWLDTQVFIPPNRTLSTPETISTAAADPASTLLYHYSLLMEYVAYINHVIYDVTGHMENFAEGNSIKEQLRVITQQIYNCACSLRIGLINLDLDTADAGETPALCETFLSIDIASFTKEVSRVYLVLHDGLRITHYLLVTYDSMAQSIAER